MIQVVIRCLLRRNPDHLVEERGGDQRGAVVVDHDKMVSIEVRQPQPIGSCQLTKVRADDRGGRLRPDTRTDRPVLSTPAMSRTTPSVISPATPRCLIRAQRMSPKIQHP